MLNRVLQSFTKLFQKPPPAPTVREYPTPASRQRNGLSAAIETMVSQRTKARKEKNWAESDRLSDQLKNAGVVIEDGPSGTTWRVHRHPRVPKLVRRVRTSAGAWTGRYPK